MNNIRRFYNQNRRLIWRIVIIIASCILLLQLVNWWVRKSNERESAVNTNNTVTKENTMNNQIHVTSEKSTVTGEKISSEKISSSTEIITEFLENCNNQRIEKAYNMLTEECKEEMYSSMDEFEAYYCRNYFDEPRASFEIENWFGNTYKVNIVPDMLAIGNAGNKEVTQDYITLVKVDNEYKLNINNYVGRYKNNNIKEQDGITIKINSKDIYMDYEKYNITVKNQNINTVYLDTREDVRTMYLLDKNQLKYPAVVNELEDEELRVLPKEEKSFDIKYYSKYNSTKTMQSLVFSDIVIDSDKYTNEGEKDGITIAVDL